MATDELSPWGRVDETGTVFVRESEGERAVGQYPDGSPEEALAAARAAILGAETNGQIDPGAAGDLDRRLEEIARALGKPNSQSAAHKVDDLRRRLDDLVRGEQLSSAGLASISAPLDRLAALLPESPGHGHGHKHGDNS